MSFFVSKEIESIVDENCLIDKKKFEQKFSLADIEKNVFLQIDEIKFIDQNNLKIHFICNLSMFEKIFTKKLNLVVQLEESSIPIISYNIVKLKRLSNDNYNIKLNCILEKESYNV
tara:strand:- start:196 stop:543 length:348 start_codon:yes stop_codon:yes gene_type:complete